MFYLYQQQTIHIEKLKEQREQHVIRAQKLGCTPKERNISCITVHRKSLLSQLVAKAVDCWSK